MLEVRGNYIYNASWQYFKQSSVISIHLVSSIAWLWRRELVMLFIFVSRCRCWISLKSSSWSRSSPAFLQLQSSSCYQTGTNHTPRKTTRRSLRGWDWTRLHHLLVISLLTRVNNVESVGTGIENHRQRPEPELGGVWAEACRQGDCLHHTVNIG